MKGAILYDWRRLWSVKSTWLMTITYLLFLLLLGLLPIYAAEGTPPQSWLGLLSTSSNFLLLVFLSVVAAASFGHEYRYGVIRLTLSEFPDRHKILIAKTFVISMYVAIVTGTGWLLLCLGALMMPDRWVRNGVEGFTLGNGPVPSLWQVPMFSVAYCLIAFSIALLTRNLALGVVLPLLQATLIEALILGLLSLSNGRFDWVERILPMGNAFAWLDNSRELPFAGWVFLAWVVGIYTLSATRFALKDA